MDRPSAEPERPSNLWLKVSLGFSTLLLLAFAFIAVRGSGRFDREDQVLSNPATSPQVYGHVAKFSLTIEDGKPFDSDALRGKIWIADFFFTRCPGTCLSMAKSMLGLRKNLGPLATDVPTVSFTMDSEFDSPAILKQYHETRADGLPNWIFLTGSKDAITTLSRESFMLAAQEKMSSDADILHSTHFVLVDKQMQIRGFYDGLDPEQVKRLESDVRTLSAR